MSSDKSALMNTSSTLNVVNLSFCHYYYLFIINMKVC